MEVESDVFRREIMKKCGWDYQFRLERMNVMLRNMNIIKIWVPMTFISGSE